MQRFCARADMAVPLLGPAALLLLDEEPPTAKKLRASSSSRASSEVHDERVEPFVPRDSLPVPFNGTWMLDCDGMALSRVVCCCSQARAPLSHGAPVWGELPSPMCRLM